MAVYGPKPSAVRREVDRVSIYDRSTSKPHVAGIEIEEFASGIGIDQKDVAKLRDYGNCFIRISYRCNNPITGVENPTLIAVGHIQGVQVIASPTDVDRAIFHYW